MGMENNQVSNFSILPIISVQCCGWMVRYEHKKLEGFTRGVEKYIKLIGLSWKCLQGLKHSIHRNADGEKCTVKNAPLIVHDTFLPEDWAVIKLPSEQNQIYSMLSGGDQLKLINLVWFIYK